MLEFAAYIKGETQPKPTSASAFRILNILTSEYVRQFETRKQAEEWIDRLQYLSDKPIKNMFSIEEESNAQKQTSKEP